MSYTAKVGFMVFEKATGHRKKNMRTWRAIMCVRTLLLEVVVWNVLGSGMNDLDRLGTMTK